MTAAWAAGAAVLALASFVMGLAGFGIGLVALGFLPFLMPPATAVVLVTLYATVFAGALLVQLRGEVMGRALLHLALGTVAGAPLGVWVLAAATPSLLNRLIGLMLLAAVALEAAGVYPRRADGWPWGVGAGLLAGLLGGAVGTPGPPVILYLAAQRGSPRAAKATLQAFFLVNEGVILGGYAWVGLFTAEVARLALAFALPALAGAVLGARLFERIDAARFRRLVFALLLVLGLVLLVRG